MTTTEAQKMLDKIFGQIFGFQNPYSLEQFLQKHAFDVRLPLQVFDSTTGEETWAQSANPSKFVRFENTINNPNLVGNDWMLPKQSINSMEDILAIWNQINYTATERTIDSVNVHESDNIYESENVFRAQDISGSNNILFSDGVTKSEFVAASQRSSSLSYCIRTEDSKESSNSFAVSWSSRVQNSMFIHDARDLYECLFCSHLSSRKYCIANMQYEEKEYFRIKKMVIEWILIS